MIVKSRFPEILIPNLNISQYVFEALDKYGNDIALVDANNDQKSLTFRQVKELSIKCANAFASFGLGHGDIIATCFSNCVEFPSLLLGAGARRVTVTTCNPNYTKEEIKKQFLNSQPKVVFIDGLDYQKILDVAKDIPSIKHIFSMDEVSNCKSFHDLVNSTKVEDFSFANGNPSKDVFILPYSSGTTGPPKGVMVTQRNFVSYGEMLKLAMPSFRLDTIYLCIPMFHIYAASFSITKLCQGSKMVIAKRFDIEEFFKAMEKHKVTILPAVPPILLAIYKSHFLSKYDISSLKQVFCGAAPLPIGVALEIKTKLDASLYQGWGLTEGLFTTGSADPFSPINSVGSLMPNSELKIIDMNSGGMLGPEEEGEVCVRGPQVMKGYYKNPEATARTMDSKGWLHTGDIGHYDQHGYIYIVDRLKELIKYKGFQVAPAELEEVLISHPLILDAAVIGIPDTAAGEVPKAFVVRKDDSLKANDIHEYVKGKISSYKYLRGGVVFKESIPKSPSGKILRRELRALEQKSKL